MLETEKRIASVTVSGLHLISGFEAAPITLDYVILLVAFGTVLQLLRLVTNSLWTPIGFHLTYLFSSRFIVLQREARFFTYDEIEPGTGELFIIFMMTRYPHLGSSRAEIDYCPA